LPSEVGDADDQGDRGGHLIDRQGEVHVGAWKSGRPTHGASAIAEVSTSPSTSASR
jgi:hypothetical protein